MRLLIIDVTDPPAKIPGRSVYINEKIPLSAESIPCLFEYYGSAEAGARRSRIIKHQCIERYPCSFKV